MPKYNVGLHRITHSFVTVGVQAANAAEATDIARQAASNPTIEWSDPVHEYDYDTVKLAGLRKPKRKRS